MNVSTIQKEIPGLPPDWGEGWMMEGNRNLHELKFRTITRYTICFVSFCRYRIRALVSGRSVNGTATMLRVSDNVDIPLGV